MTQEQREGDGQAAVWIILLAAAIYLASQYKRPSGPPPAPAPVVKPDDECPDGRCPIVPKPPKRR